MSKRQLIEEIRQFNTTAKPEFLEQFDESALGAYLTSLQEVAKKRANAELKWTRSPSSYKIAS